MRLRPTLALAAFAFALGSLDARAAVRVPATPGALARALSATSEGDTLVLAAGVHRGPVRIERRLTLRGEAGAVIEGPRAGTVIAIAANGSVVEDVDVRGSGARVLTVDSGIRVIRAANVAIRRVRFEDVLYGVYAERAADLAIERCTFVGRVPPMKEDGEGNGIHLWYCADPRLVANDVQRFTDGIYLSFVDRAHVEANVLHDCGRYGLHTMYCQRNDLVANRFLTNVAGCAIMFSNHLRVERNDFWRNRGPRTYGLLLRDCSDGEFTNNRMVDNTIAAFLDNSNRNRFRGNLVQDNGWGLLIFASCAQNEVAGNDFVNNDYPVALDMKYTTNRFDDGEQGNYWSEHAPYDLDGDRRGDVPYSPVTAFAFVSKQYPDLSVLAKSPAVAALGVAERVVPALRPSEAVDRHPRVTPVAVTGTGHALERPDGARASWGARFAFAALFTGGLAGFVRRRRSA